MIRVSVIKNCVLLTMSILSRKNSLLLLMFFALLFSASSVSAQSGDDAKKRTKELKRKYELERKEKEKEIKEQEKEYQSFLKQKKAAEIARRKQLKRETKLTEEYKKKQEIKRKEDLKRKLRQEAIAKRDQLQKDAEENFTHAVKQAYIAFSHAITAAAFEEVDATPLEGFDPAAVDEILDLRAKGLRSCVMLPIGYRNAQSDWLVNLKKVRKSREDLITEIV